MNSNLLLEAACVVLNKDNMNGLEGEVYIIWVCVRLCSMTVGEADVGVVCVCRG